VRIKNPFKVAPPAQLLSEIPKPEFPTRRKVLRVTAILAAFIISASALSVYLWLSALGVFNLDTRHIDTLVNYNFHDNSIVYDRDGQKIGEIFDKYHVFVPYHEVPQHFINALIAIEDRKFHNHRGIDFKGIARALAIRLRTGRATQGASTLTQQLVRNTLLSTEKTLDRKILEIAWSLEVEKHIPKEKIIEIYVNSMFLGNGSYGVGAAAQRYFGKKAQDLAPAESALLAGLFQSPSRYNPARFPERAKRRQAQVLDAMRKSGFITARQSQELKSETLVYKPYKYINNQKASWFVDYIQESLPRLQGLRTKNSKGSGLRIYTTLDTKLQRLAEFAVESHDARIRDLEYRTGRVQIPMSNQYKNASVEAAMLVTDPRTGDILAMVGGRDYATSQFNRAINALRSPGSAFKPVVFTEALTRGFKWSDVIYVSPVNIENYRPKNLEDDYLTETTMLRAFYRSMNAPTIEIATKVGISPIIERAKSLGVQSPGKEEVGTALGSSDVTMSDLARLYGTFATGGVLTDLAAIEKITNAEGTVLWQRPLLTSRQKRVLNSQIAYLMTQGLRSVLTSGTGQRSSDLAAFAAGKTGTSNNSADNWFCGFTPDLVSIVWVGTDENVPILSAASGGSVALPIWDQFMRSTFPIRKPRGFYRPEGIAEATIHPMFGHRVSTGARMYFLTGNQPLETESSLEKISNSSDGAYRNVFRH
jgi:1A family penicillin-binding protein